MNDLNSVREKANRFFLFKILLNLALLILGTALVMFLSSKIQVASELNKQRGYCEESLDEAVKLFDVNRTGVEELTRVYHEENLDMVESLTRFVLSEKAQTLAEADHDTQLQIFTEIQKKRTSSISSSCERMERWRSLPKGTIPASIPSNTGFCQRTISRRSYGAPAGSRVR